MTCDLFSTHWFNFCLFCTSTSSISALPFMFSAVKNSWSLEWREGGSYMRGEVMGAISSPVDPAAVSFLIPPVIFVLILSSLSSAGFSNL